MGWISTYRILFTLSGSTGLSLAVSLFSDKIGPKLLRAINAVCGVVIIFYGLKLLYGLTKFF